MNIIPNWKERNLRCHFCGETRSVKYEIEVFDPVIDSKPSNVCMCNKCALRYREPVCKIKRTDFGYEWPVKDE